MLHDLHKDCWISYWFVLIEYTLVCQISQDGRKSGKPIHYSLKLEPFDLGERYVIIGSSRIIQPWLAYYN
jgi:hypothetical protein